MAEDLFSGFDTVSAEAWKARIERDLRGRDYGRTLRWTSPEGITTEPFYTAEDLEQLRQKYPEVPPAALALPEESSWRILERIAVQEAGEANRQALDALNSGAEGIVFDLQGKALTADMVSALTRDILVDVAPVSMVNHRSIDPAVRKLKLPLLTGDLLLHALRNGSYQPGFLDENLEQCTPGSGHFDLEIDGAAFGAAGSNMVQELGYALAIGQEYLHAWPHSEAPKCYARLSTGTNFFFDIARFRAFRQLWSAMTVQYAWGALPVFVEATGTAVNKSLLDPHNNLLRNTSEGMAAAIGGADAVVLTPFDLTGKQDQEGRRWARNISLLLRYEAHLDKAADPAKGSYYLETITRSLAEQAWELFRETEKEGGFISAWRKGMVLRAIDRSKAEAWEALARRETTLVGVNDYPAAGGALTTVPETDDGSDPLVPIRIAEGFERLRVRALNYQETGKPAPRALLVGTGPLAMQKARVNYSASLLGCAGIDCGEAALEDVGEKLAQSWNLVVLCSDDASWPEALASLRRVTELPLVLAGNPAALGPDDQQIIDFAIYRGCNVYRVLTDLQQTILT